MVRIFCFLLFLPFSLRAQNDITGDYNGYIDLKVTKLKVVLHLQEDDRRLSGTIDIPEQQAFGLELDQLKLSKGELSCTIPKVPGNAGFTGQWRPAEDSISGTYSQNGRNFPLRTKKVKDTGTEKTKHSLAAKIMKIEAYVDTVLRRGRMAGCAVGIVHNGQVLLNTGFGYRDAGQKIKCDAHTLFAIGSCTKAFTAALLATLNDEGLFDWEKPVKSYVPYFGMKDKFADEQINGIDICTHRSGLPRHDMVWYGSALSRRELVERIRYMEPNKPFRTTWQYNNFMFVTAGVVAEEIAHDTWENLLQKRIFDPLGMTDSKNHFADFSSASNKSFGYEERDRKIEKTDYRNIDAMGPAGSIASSSTDMLQWVKLLLDKGAINGQQVISENQTEFLMSPQMVMPQNNDGDFKQSCYALGWMVSQYKGKTFVEHGGNIDGFTAEVALFPEENLGIVVLSNKDHSGIPSMLALYMADRMLDHEEYDWFEEKLGKSRNIQETREDQEKANAANNRDKKAKEKTKQPKNPGPLHLLKDYTGSYKDEAYGTINIGLENGELVAHLNTFDMKMQHDAFETFKMHYRDEELKTAFFTNTAGKIEWMQLQLDALSKPITFYKTVPDYLNDKKYMDKVVGSYTLGELTLTLSMDKNKFMARASDGQEFELVPSGDNLFKLKGIEGYNMEMVFDDKGNCIKVISHQPNGDFEATKK